MANSEHLAAVLRGEAVPNADLRRADLGGADLAEADLRGANLRGADLRNANLRCACLLEANLRWADLTRANLTGANLTRADLTGADLKRADLAEACLEGADLSGANLCYVRLAQADLSGVKGIIDPATWLAANCESDGEGIICYKVLPSPVFTAPERWPDLRPGAVLQEVVNPDRCTQCGSGVNVATLGWIKENYPEVATFWRCRIAWRDLAGVVVPFHTDGKFRAGRVTLLEEVTK